MMPNNEGYPVKSLANKKGISLYLFLQSYVQLGNKQLLLSTFGLFSSVKRPVLYTATPFIADTVRTLS